jgi:hypothetical protein
MDGKTWLLANGYSQWADGTWQQGGYEVYALDEVLNDYAKYLKGDNAYKAERNPKQSLPRSEV